MNPTNVVNEFTLSEIREGLPVVVYISNILNNGDTQTSMFNSLWPDSKDHFIAYLKSKLGSAVSHHTNKISGALYVGYRSIPDEDRFKIINWANQHIDVSMKSIKVTLWFLKWCFCELGITWMSDILELTGEALEAEWQIYKKSHFEDYFVQLGDVKLQKYIDAINLGRIKNPYLGETMDLYFGPD